MEMDMYDGGVLSQEKDSLFLILTPAGGKYIASFTALKNAAKDFDPDRRFGLFSVFGRQQGNLEFKNYALPLGMSDIYQYVESVLDTEPVGCATIEEPSSEKPPLEVSGY